jgi:uncharacterized protein YpbB
LPQCGSCGNCDPSTKTAAPPRDEEYEPRAVRTRTRSGTKSAPPVTRVAARAITTEESLAARKILACAARMKGRFGKAMLAAVLRGSREKKLLLSKLDQLTTYGILGGMKQDELLVYIDALQQSGCLELKGDEYPTIFITAFGEQVMREQVTVQLALPDPETVRPPSHPPMAPKARDQHTLSQTYALYEQGLSIEEVAARRGLTPVTIEQHLVDCIVLGHAVDIARFVPAAERAAIEKAVAELGLEKLRPLKEALPETFTYRMIRLVVADLSREKEREEARGASS